MSNVNIGSLRGAFVSPSDADAGYGVRPVVFDIVAPDGRTSLLDGTEGLEDIRLVLHVNPRSMSISYTKIIERIETKSGYVEQHFGDGTQSINFDMATGGFMRLYTGLTSITGDGTDYGGNRRQSIAYDKYLDILFLFKNNGMIRDVDGNPVFDGQIKCIFDNHIFYGWFENFSVSESADQPYQFSLSTSFVVSHEAMTLRSTVASPPVTTESVISDVRQSAAESIATSITDVLFQENAVATSQTTLPASNQGFEE